MTSTGFQSPWQGVWTLDTMINRRIPRPRATGISMVIDNGLGVAALRDLLALAAEHIDHWKFGFGTSALMPLSILEEKLDLLHQHGILTYPGGTLLEAAVVQAHCRVYMQRATELGFGAVEISEGTIDLPRDRRQRMIDCARNAGLIPITEVGRKDPNHQPSAEELAKQALQDLAWGAVWVIVEARECGRGIGIFDKDGAIRTNFLDEITRLAGDAEPRLIWEAPLHSQQAFLVRRFGANVSLGNIAPQECLALEAMRCGLRYETFAGVAQHSYENGQWDPAWIEAAAPNGRGGSN